jgi:hypothetical protein
MRWPWSRRPPADTQEQTAEAERVKRLKQQTESLTDRLAQAADALEQVLNQQQAKTMRPGDQWK